MDKFVIKRYPQRYWGVAEVFKNGSKVADINKFYEVTAEWILIYDTEGSSGTGFRKGNLIQKIFIGDAEFAHDENSEP